MCFLGQCCSVVGPGEVLCDVYTQELGAGHSLHGRTIDGQRSMQRVHSPEVNDNFLRLLHIQREIVVTCTTRPGGSPHSCSFVSSLLLMRPTTVVSSANLMKRLELCDGVQSWVSRVNCDQMRLFRSLIILILLYGLETWTLLKMEINKLETFQMQCQTVRQQCGNQPMIKEAIQKRRLQWYRMDISRLPYKLLLAQRRPTWKVRYHAPKKTWAKQVEDSLKNRCFTLVDSKTLSTDRLAWGQVVEVAGRPSAPTAAYELRSRLRHNAKDKREREKEGERERERL